MRGLGRIEGGASGRKAPVRSVGVMGDGRSYEQVLALRAVTSVDGMTADFFPFDMVPVPRLGPHYQRGERHQPRHL
jgi:hypothetical protein